MSKIYERLSSTITPQGKKLGLVRSPKLNPVGRGYYLAGSIDHVKVSNLDPSNDTIDSCTQNDINTSNDEPSNSNSNSNSLVTSNDVPSNSLASSNKTSGSGSRVAKSTGARVKSQVSGSSSPPVRSSPRVQSQKVRGRHISDAAAVAALSSVSRSVSSSERRALQRVFSKK